MDALARWGFRMLMVVGVLTPTLALAQGAGIPARIVPCSGAIASGGLQACNVCHLAELAQNIINTGIFITIFLSAMLFAYAGWLYLTQESIPGQKKARDLFQNVTFGLVIILAGWIIVDTIMKEVLDTGRFGPWNDLQCEIFNP